MKATLSLLLGAAVLAGAGARADEQTIRQVLAPKLGDGKIVEVRKLGQAVGAAVDLQRSEADDPKPDLHRLPRADRTGRQGVTGRRC